MGIYQSDRVFQVVLPGLGTVYAYEKAQNMAKTVILAVLTLLPFTARAVPEKFPVLKVGEDYYTNVVVTTVTATDIYFSHSRGMGNAKLRKLDPTVQRQFHYDPVRAMAKQTEQAQANARYASTAKQSAKKKVESDTTTIPPVIKDTIPPHEISANSFLDRPAPNLSVGKWLGTPPDTTGKFVLIDFWATWCGPCRRSIPILNKLAEKYKDKLVIIGISEETDTEVRAMREPQVSYNLAVDPQHRASEAVGVQRIPHALLVDPQGIVRFEGHPGYLEGVNLDRLFAKYGS